MNRPNSPRIAVELRGVSVRFGEHRVLEDVDLAVAENDFLGIIGPNGAGKSVLLRTILGQLKPESGKVEIFGKPIDESRGRIAYVPQFAGFDSSFPIQVMDVVLMGRLGSGLFHRYHDDDRKIARAALEQVNLGALAKRQVGKLSGGELQRVLIARALAMEAPILLLDEPTASLDTPVAKSLYELMGALAKSMTVILVSHDIGVMSKHVQSFACLNRRLVHHHSQEITPQMLEETYGHDVRTIEHDHPVLE